MNAEEAFAILKEKLNFNTHTYIKDCGLPNDLKAHLYESLKLYQSLQHNYVMDNPLTEENWLQFKAIIDIYFSPLMKALT